MIFIVLIALVAFLYSSVGHAGASGYIAVMSLLHFAPESIRPTALVLNLFVAVVATLQFTLAGHFRWSLFWPFAICAVTGAALGFLAGLTGTGGGIFLTPLMLLTNWAIAKEAAAVSAPFLLVNSAAGFLFPAHMPTLIAAMLVAGCPGSGLSAWKLPAPAIRVLLSS